MHAAVSHCFPKAEKLKSRKEIDILFREGKSFFAAPVKCYYRITPVAAGLRQAGKDMLPGEIHRENSDNALPSAEHHLPDPPERDIYPESGPGIKAGFSVSKRQFKKAVDRNRIKRLMREAFRLHKHKLSAGVKAHPLGLVIFFVFTDKTMPGYALVEEKMKYCIRRLGKIVEAGV